MNIQYSTIIFTLFAVHAASAQIPAEKAFPPASLFGEAYGKTGVDPFSLEYLNGRKPAFEEHMVTITTYFENESNSIFSVSFHEDKNLIEEKFLTAHTEFRSKQVDLTSAMQEDDFGRFYTLKLHEVDPGNGTALVTHRALIHNVMFELTGDSLDKRFRKWIEDYSRYLTQAYIQESVEYRDWEGANGKIVKGHVHSVSADKTTIRFETEDGTIYPDLSLGKFSEKSRKEILDSP